MPAKSKKKQTLQVDPTQLLCMVNGDPVLINGGEWSLGDAVAVSLYNCDKPGQQKSAEDRYKEGKLARRFEQAEGVIELTSEEHAMALKAVGEVAPKLCVVPAMDALNQGPEPE